MDENKNTELNGFDSAYKGDEIPESTPAATPETTEPQPAESSFTPAQNTYGFFPSGSYGNENGSNNDRYYPVPEKPVSPKAAKAKSGNSAGVVILSVLLSLVVGAVSGFGAAYIFSGSNTGNDGSTESTPSAPSDYVNKTVNITGTVESAVQAVAEKAGPSVVGIRTTTSVNNFFGGSTEATAGEGSGVIYRSDGYIITNYHVIEGAVNSGKTTISVYLPTDDTTAIAATVVGYSIASDLAVIKINMTGLPAIEVADSDKLAVGEYAIAIGNPGGLEFMGSVTYGIISGLNRTLTVEGVGEMSVIQTDAAINPGNSGGALVNTKGELVGINSTKLVSTSYEGMGFAIPSNTVVDICNKIIENENAPTPYVGITLSTTYDEDTLNMLGYPAGAVVQSVADGSPAAECGIRRGDIITEFNGEKITDYQAFSNAVADSEPGELVTVQFYRSGRYYSTSLAIGANNEQ